MPDLLVSSVTYAVDCDRQLLSPAPAWSGPSVQVTPLASETDRKNGAPWANVMVHFTDWSGHNGETVSEATREEEKHTEGDIEWRAEGRCYRQSVRWCALDPSISVVDWF
jgi:predicted nucleic acid-binding Zn ribbon protein